MDFGTFLIAADLSILPNAKTYAYWRKNDAADIMFVEYLVTPLYS